MRCIFCWLEAPRRVSVDRHGRHPGAYRRVIDVAFTPAELRRCDVAVVIDVLRATSVVTQALTAGYERVLCTETVEHAETLHGYGRVLAGERHCRKPPGFDQGNSPRAAAHRHGDELVLATTNGAPTIVAAARLVPEVLLACLRNLAAVVDALRGDDRPQADVQLVCAGTDGAAALEDTYVAGRLSAALSGPRTDAAQVAEAVARGFAAPLQALSRSADARILRSSGQGADVPYCATESVLDVVPRVMSVHAGVATITGASAAAGPAGSSAAAGPAAPVDGAATVQV